MPEAFFNFPCSGFVGTPFDLKPLAETLAENRFKVVVPALPGQLKKSFAYDRTKYSPDFYTNWLAGIIRTETHESGEKPYLIGFSMGGTLSTVVASKNSIDKLVLIAPFYSLNFADKLIQNVSRTLRWVFPVLPKLKKGFIKIPDGYKEYEGGSYIVSLDSYNCLEKLDAMAKKKAPEISVPVLVIGSRNDEVASFKTTTKTWQSNKNADVLEFPDSNHIMLYDSNRDEIISNVTAFLTKDTNHAVKNKTKMHTNQLINSTSPYLLQHAHNPVDWYPWGEKAFEKARKENKPIFLSIGYSACHWCHVMEKESFENEDIADFLNKNFVSIKVDREERPDIDSIYMNFVQMTTGSGGWPMSVFLTPDLKPFFGGTYFPPENKYGRAGFKTLLTEISDAWKNKKNDILGSAEQITRILRVAANTGTSGKINSNIISNRTFLFSKAEQNLVNSFDGKWGGFGGAPKFPPAGKIAFLLRMFHKSQNSNLLEIAEFTLNQMAYGGIYDHLGGGFHRYSVDEKWFAPHFEKMLYDNALLAGVYIDAYLITKNPFYKKIAEEILNYILRDMTDSKGGFYSSEDADSEGKEGEFYTWTKPEIISVLGKEDGELFCKTFNVTGQGNFEEKNILFLDSELPEDNKINSLKNKLFEFREKKIHPHKDDKVMASWNGLMISAFAKAYGAFGDQKYLDAGKKAAQFFNAEMTESNILYRIYRNGKRSIHGFLNDYANMASAYLELYEIDFDDKWLYASEKLADSMINKFWNEKNECFLLNSENHKNLIADVRPTYDSSIPSGSAVASMVLLKLSRLTGNENYNKIVASVLEKFAPEMEKYPSGYAYMLAVLDFYLSPAKEIVIAGKRGMADTEKLIEVVNSVYHPNTITAFSDADIPENKKTELTRGRKMVDGKAVAYICENNVCKLPVTSIEKLSEFLISY